MEKIFIPMNLQFFAEDNNGDGENNAGSNSSNGTGSTSGTSNSSSGDSGTGQKAGEPDVVALAEIISEKDKVIEQLQKDVESLKKSNAQLTVMINSDKFSSGKKSFEENLLTMVGAKPRKE